MRNSHKSQQMQVNAGSMADIAFLLLTFFMITTTIVNDKGITLLLPPERLEVDPVPIHERNIFKIQINSQDKLLIEGQPRENIKQLREEIKIFILNNGQSSELSESPEKAIVSIKTNRGTTQEIFIKTLDEVKAAYYEIYAERAGVSPKAYRDLSVNVPAEKLLYDKGKKGIPMNISIAEPSS